MKISIIIATYNRCEHLKKILASLIKQERNTSFTFEIIVADNNSTDATKTVAESFKPRFNEDIKYLFESKQGKSYALNSAIQSAQGDIVVFTDDDVIADPDWLINIVECFKRYDCDGLGGRILPVYPPGTAQWIIDNADLLVGPIVYYDYGESLKPYVKPMYEFLGANFSFKKNLFEESGLFRTDIGPGKGKLGEDTEITNRFLKAGKKLYYCGNAIIRHPVDSSRMSLKYIARWYFELGKYRTVIDEQGKIPTNLIYIAGVPRYLIGQILKQTLQLVLNILNTRNFLRIWINLFINIGKAKEIRHIYYNNTKQKI